MRSGPSGRDGLEERLQALVLVCLHSPLTLQATYPQTIYPLYDHHRFQHTYLPGDQRRVKQFGLRDKHMRLHIAYQLYDLGMKNYL